MSHKRVLVLGAGQLARMMSLAGAPLNIDVIAFDVRTDKIIHPLTQQLQPYSLTQAIAGSDVITAEFEHIAPSILDICQQSGKLYPSPQAIKTGGDRRLEKALLDEANVANAQYAIIDDRHSFDLAISEIGLPLVLKTALGGYDGKGQWRIKQNDDIEAVWSEVAEALKEPHQAIIAEEFVKFNREVSMIGARKRNGDSACYALTENLHINGVLALSIPIENEALQQQAKQMFNAVTEQLNYIGVLAIEFFEQDGQLFVNEIAPRVHNSGHWTQQGADVCQFENHLRAICNFELGSTHLTRPTAMINLLGVDSLPEPVFATPSCHIHWYGKEKQVGRKMGHINVCAENFPALHKKLKEVIGLLPEDDFTEIKALRG